MESNFQHLRSPIQSTFEKDSTKKDDDTEIPDYEKKRLENIAEKKAMFEEKLKNAKLLVKAKPFKCSKCLSDFMKKAQLKSHQCFKCDLCFKYFKTNVSFYVHDRVEHDGYFAKELKLKRPERKKKDIDRFAAKEEKFEEGKKWVRGRVSKKLKRPERKKKAIGRFVAKKEKFEEGKIWARGRSSFKRYITLSNGSAKEIKIEKLLDKRYRGAMGIHKQYLVKWQGLGNEHNTWESKSNLPVKVIASFEEEQSVKN